MKNGNTDLTNLCITLHDDNEVRLTLGSTDVYLRLVKKKPGTNGGRYQCKILIQAPPSVLIDRLDRSVREA